MQINKDFFAYSSGIFVYFSLSFLLLFCLLDAS